MDLFAATSALSVQLDRLPAPRGVAAIVNPLTYAWGAHCRYLQRFTHYEKHPTRISSQPVRPFSEGTIAQRRRVLIVGMNPGPHGMVQTGVPFGDVSHARRILGLPDGYALAAGEPSSFADIRRHGHEWPLVESWPNGVLLHLTGKGKLARRVEGFAHKPVEVSGDRLWPLLESLWGGLDAVLADCFVMNLVPLAYFAEGGQNVTPEELDGADRARVLRPCIDYLRAVLAAMRPEVIVAVGRWVEGELRGGRAATPDDIADGVHRSQDAYAAALRSGYHEPLVVYLPHPSPRGTQAAAWAQQAARVLAPYTPKEQS